MITIQHLSERRATLEKIHLEKSRKIKSKEKTEYRLYYDLILLLNCGFPEWYYERERIRLRRIIRRIETDIESLLEKRAYQLMHENARKKLRKDIRKAYGVGEKKRQLKILNFILNN